MTATRLERSVGPFLCDGYEIYDRDLSTLGEVVIFSPSTCSPTIGDEFTIESGGHAHDVEVRAIVRFEEGGWSASCRVTGWV